MIMNENNYQEEIVEQVSDADSVPVKKRSFELITISLLVVILMFLLVVLMLFNRSDPIIDESNQSITSESSVEDPETSEIVTREMVQNLFAEVVSLEKIDSSFSDQVPDILSLVKQDIQKQDYESAYERLIVLKSGYQDKESETVVNEPESEVGLMPPRPIINNDDYDTSDTVNVLAARDCSSSVNSAVCHDLVVACSKVPDRNVTVRQSQEGNKDSGTIVFTTGSTGSGVYSDRPVAGETIKILNEEGFETFEIYWTDDKGWTTGVNSGFSGGTCGTAEVTKWIAGNVAKNTETMCAQGNSGGSAQIAYMLAEYGMEDLFDMVILSGGPPPGRLDIACFGDETDPSLKDTVFVGSNGGVVDALLGWETERYCSSGSGPDWALEILKDDSLASPTKPKDWYYPNTKVNFVQSESDVSHSDELGRYYYDVITSEKKWYEIPGSVHTLDNYQQSAEIIRQLFIEECR